MKSLKKNKSQNWNLYLILGIAVFIFLSALFSFIHFLADVEAVPSNSLHLYSELNYLNIFDEPLFITYFFWGFLPLYLYDLIMIIGTLWVGSSFYKRKNWARNVVVLYLILIVVDTIRRFVFRYLSFGTNWPETLIGDSIILLFLTSVRVYLLYFLNKPKIKTLFK